MALCWAHLPSEGKLKKLDSTHPHLLFKQEELTDRCQLGQVFHLAVKLPLSTFNWSCVFGCSAERPVGQARRNDSGPQLERWAEVITERDVQLWAHPAGMGTWA